MKNKHLSSVLLCLVLVACHSDTKSLQYVKAKMKSIQAFINTHADNMSVLVKLSGKDTLIDLRKSIPSPKEMEVIYSYLKDPSGHVIVFGETLIKKNKDCESISTHYFDKDGKTLAFTNQNIFFKDAGSDKIVNELIMESYDKSFRQISRERTLIDSKGNTLSEKNLMLPHEPYKTYSNSDSLLKKISLPVK